METPKTKKKSQTNTSHTDTTSGASLLIGILVIAAFVVILNETTLSVALPVLMDEFSIAADLGQWLTTAFMLTMAVVIPMTGFIMQRFTLRSIFVAAMSTFLLGTVLAAASVHFAMLLLARIIQASGTALVIPLLMTTIMRLVPLERRGQVFGFVTVAIAVAPALGPTFSGVVLELLGWRWIFLLVTPLVLGVLLLGVAKVRNFEDPTEPSLDILSVVLSAVGFAATVYGISGLSAFAEGVPVVSLVCVVTGLLVLFIFSRRQRSLATREQSGDKVSPLLNLQPLSSREFVLSLVLMLLTFSMLFGFIILMPIYGQRVVGLSELQTGLVTLPGGAIMAFMGPAVGRMYDAKGVRPLIIPGAILLVAAMFGFAFIEETQSLFTWVSEDTQRAHLVHLIVLAMLLNAGIGLMMTPLMSNALAAVPDHLAAHGQAILNTLQQVAGGIGTAIFVALMTIGVAKSATTAANAAEATAYGVHIAFFAAAGVSVVVVLFSIFIRFDSRDAASPSGAHVDNTAG